jgi:hypothetical protein
MKVIPKLSAVIKRYSLLAIATGLVWLLINPEISTGDRLCMSNIYAFGLLFVGSLVYLRLIISDLAKREKTHRMFRAMQAGCLAATILLCIPVIINAGSRGPSGHNFKDPIFGITILSTACFFIFLAIDFATRSKREDKSGEGRRPFMLKWLRHRGLGPG